MQGQSSHPDLEFWAKRLALFHDTAEGALHILRDLGITRFTTIYTSAEAEWRGEADINPCVVFPFNDRAQQEIFFKAVEEACMTLDKVPEGDYRMYVLCTPSQSY